MSPSDHEIIIDWTPKNGIDWWNETCATVLEVFGLPGHRFVYTPSEDFMTFTFKKIMSKERIVRSIVESLP